VLQNTSLQKLRAQTGGDHHFWQGKVGIWRALFTVKEVDLLCKTQGGLCADLGYDCTADQTLPAVVADDNWIRLAWGSLADKIQNSRILQDIVPKLESMVAACRLENEKLRDQVSSLERALEEIQAAYDPEDIDLARKLHELAARFPRISHQARQAARLGRWLRHPGGLQMQR